MSRSPKPITSSWRPVALLALVLAILAPATAQAAVTVTSAEITSDTLRIAGRAIANRSITVDGASMTKSDGAGVFRVARSGYRAPADCTVDVNDGSATPTVARLTGCSVAPASAPLAFTSETGSFALGGELGFYGGVVEVGTFSNRWFRGSGGALPYRWTTEGALPPGLALVDDSATDDQVRIGGTPTTAGTHPPFTLRLTDSRGTTVAHAITVTVGDGTLPGPGLNSVSVGPASVTGGASSTGTVTTGVPAPAEGAFVSLASGNRLVASVPASGAVTIPAGATSTTFPITTSSVTTSTAVPISASYGGITRTATLTVTPSPSTTVPDTVSIGRAEYDSGKRELRIEATSNRAGTTLRAYTTTAGALIGTLSSGSGTFTVSANPGSVTVKSSGGGTATRSVTAK